MDYEKLYKDAISRAKKLKETCDSKAVVGWCWCEYIFPELKESEDEKIRKLCEVLVRTCFMNELCTKEDNDDCIAWLEKQGEQKPTWSEEDENVLEDIEEAIINYWHGDTQDIILEWLKSLKQRMKGE